MLRIKIIFLNVSLINVHAPTEEREQLKKEVFYQKLEDLYDSCPSNDVKIVLGNWNAEVRREEFYQGVIFRQRMYVNTNNNEEMQVDFAATKTWCYPQPFHAHKNSYMNIENSRWKTQ